MQNATRYLLDRLVLENKNSIPKKDLEQLGESLDIITKKGLTGKQLYKKWNSKAVKNLAHAKPMEQIKKLLNAENGK